MKTNTTLSSLHRRDFLRGGLAVAALATTGGLAGCAASGTGSSCPRTTADR